MPEKCKSNKMLGICLKKKKKKWESEGGRSFLSAKPVHFLHPESPQHSWPRVGLLRSRPDLIPRLSSSRFLPKTVHSTRIMWGRDINVRIQKPIDRFRRPKAFSPP